MLHVVYNPNNGETVPDNKMEQFAKNAHLQSHGWGIWPYRVECGNKRLFNMFKVLVRRGEINTEDVKFKVGDEFVQL